MATSKRNRGFKKIAGTPGKLHRALGVPVGQPIPPGKKASALSGRLGPGIKRMAVNGFRGALAKGRKTSARNRKKAAGKHTLAPRPAFGPTPAMMNKMNSGQLYMLAENKIANKRKRRGQ